MTPHDRWLDVGWRQDEATQGSLLIHSEIVIVPSSEIKLPLSSNINHKLERLRVLIRRYAIPISGSFQKKVSFTRYLSNKHLCLLSTQSLCLVVISIDPGCPMTVTLVPCLVSPISHPSSWTKSVHKHQINDTFKMIRLWDNIKHHFTTLPVSRSVFYAAVKCKTCDW